MNDKVMILNIIMSKKYFLTTGIFIILPSVVLFFINYYYFNYFFLYIFIFAVFFALFMFSNRIIENKFSQKITIRLDYNSWMFIVIKNNSEEKYKLSDIKSYWIVEASTGYSTGLSFKSKLNNSKRIYFAIFNKKLSIDQTDSEEILNSFLSMINDYNKTVDINEQITFTQTFAESVYGLISIYVLSSLIIIAIFLHIIYHQIGTLPISLLFGGGILLGIIATRQNDIKRRKKMHCK